MRHPQALSRVLGVFVPAAVEFPSLHSACPSHKHAVEEWRLSFSALEHCGVKWAFVSPPECLAILCNIFTIGKKTFSVPKKQPLGEFLFKKDPMNPFEHRCHTLGSTFIHFLLYLIVKSVCTLCGLSHFPYLFKSHF